MIALNKVTKQFEELSLPADPSAENQRNHEELQQRWISMYYLHNVKHMMK